VASEKERCESRQQARLNQKILENIATPFWIKLPVRLFSDNEEGIGCIEVKQGAGGRLKRWQTRLHHFALLAGKKE